MKLNLWGKGILLTLCSIISIGYCNTSKVIAAQKNQKTNICMDESVSYLNVVKDTKPKLTEKFLQGVWISKEGFVCSYDNGTFVDNKCKVYWNCEFNEESITAEFDRGESELLKIKMIDENTIQFRGYTAVRAESKEGKKFQKQLSSLLNGKWVLADYQQKAIMEFENGKVLFRYDGIIESYDYEFKDGKLKILYDTEPDNFKVDMVLQISEDTLSANFLSEETIFYREGSKKEEDISSGKYKMIGDWIFISIDDKISKWNFNSSDKLTIDFFGKEKSNQLQYSVSADGDILKIKIGKQVYHLDGNYDSMYLYKSDRDDGFGILYPKDSKEGIYYTNKAITINQDGKIVTRTYEVDRKEESCPEIASLVLTLECRKNLWLDDNINIYKSFCNSDDSPGIFGSSYYVSSKIKLKNAKLTFTYNKEELPYSYEDDLVVVRLDPITGQTTVLKTWVNKKDHTIKARITQDGDYYLADSYVLNGGTRDILKRNPTDWELQCDTGDILSLVDIKYINASKGKFKVSTVSELASVVYYVNTTKSDWVTVSLEKDIDLSGYDWVPMGWSAGSSMNYPFKGYINGNQHTISNLHINSKSVAVGLIGWETNSVVKGLKITNASVSGYTDVGILTGESVGGSYIDCYVKGTVSGEKAGSMLGHDASVVKKNCTADVIVNGENFEFLSWNEYEKSKIIIEDYVTIAIDDNLVVNRPEVTNYINVGWMVYYDGVEIMHSSATTDLELQYLAIDPGTYEIYLSAWVSHQYVPISNKITITIK